MDRLLEADKTLSAIVAQLGAGASTPFMDAYNAHIGLPLGSKKNKAVADKQGDAADDDWSVVDYQRPGHWTASNAEAAALGVFDKNGVGDGPGLGIAGGAEFVISLLEFETDLTAADIVSAGRSALADLAHETVKDAGAAAGITSGRGASLNFLGGPQAIAEAAAAAKIDPDEHVVAMAAVAAASMRADENTLVEELLDALQVRAVNSVDPEFRPNFNIRALLDGVRPSWVPPSKVTIEGKSNMKCAEFVALNERIARAYEVAKVHFTRDMTPAAAKKIGPRHRRVEHIVLTSDVTVKDALAFVWHRHRKSKQMRVFRA